MAGFRSPFAWCFGRFGFFKICFWLVLACFGFFGSFWFVCYWTISQKHPVNKFGWIEDSQALNHGSILKKVHRVIKFNKKALPKPCIDMNIKVRQKAKNKFKKDFFKLINNAVFGKTKENVRKQRNIKLVTTKPEEII